MINTENKQIFSNFFNKFIRMTIKTDNQDKRFKKKEIFSTSSKRHQSLTTYHSPKDYSQFSFISNRNDTYIYTDNNQQDIYTHEVRTKKLFFLN